MPKQTYPHANSDASIVSQPICPGADSKAEFLRLPDVERLFGLKRSFVYKLERDGLLKTVTIRPRGSKHGVKLISTDSIRTLIDHQREA